MAKRERTGERLAERFRTERDRIRKEVREMLERNSMFKATEKRFNDFEKNLEKNFQTFLKNLNIPSRKDIERLEKKVEQLTKDLDRAQKGGKKKGKKAKKAAAPEPTGMGM